MDLLLSDAECRTVTLRGSRLTAEAQVSTGPALAALKAVNLPEIPQPRVGPYRITDWLGDGAMGSVYRAEHVSLGRAVAIKVMHRRYEDDDRYLKRFMNEARAANLIKSPYVLEITDIARDPAEGCYFVMELLEGPTLKDVIEQDAPLAPERAVRIALQLCDALAAAHDSGVIHRDVKPANVILVRGLDGEEKVKLIDFGVAKLLETDEVAAKERLTADGMVVGTPNYMALEQATGEAASPLLDVYALGVVLYEMLTGRLPHDADDFQSLLFKVASVRPPRVSSLNPAVPAKLDAIVDACLSAHPELRPAGMRALEGQLRAFDTARVGRRPAWVLPASACVLAATAIIGAGALLPDEATRAEAYFPADPLPMEVDTITPAPVPDAPPPPPALAKVEVERDAEETPVEEVRHEPAKAPKRKIRRPQHRAGRRRDRAVRPQRVRSVKPEKKKPPKALVIDQTFLLDPFASEP